MIFQLLLTQELILKFRDIDIYVYALENNLLCSTGDAIKLAQGLFS